MFQWIKKLFTKRVSLRLEENKPRPTRTVMPQIVVEKDPAKIFKVGNVFTIATEKGTYRLRLNKITNGGRLLFRQVKEQKKDQDEAA